MKLKTDPYRLTAFLLMVLGLSAALFQFIYNRSIWLDEAVLALNIIGRSSAELLKPLDYIQVAPVLYLQIVKACSLLIPDSEYGLRLFSLVCYLLSLALFYHIVKILVKNPWAILAAIALFVFNPLLLYYSGEVKQYSCDVFVTLVMLWMAVRPWPEIRKKYLLLAIAGIDLIFLSNVTVIMMTGTALGLLYSDFVKTKDGKWNSLLLMLLSWTAAFLFYYFLFIYHHPSYDRQVAEWMRYHAFLPRNPFAPEFYQFLFGSFNQVSNNIPIIPQPAPVIRALASLNTVLFYTLGFIAILSFVRKGRWETFLLLCLPVGTHLCLSALRLYPFETRIFLYLYPLFFLLLALGLEYFLDNLKGAAWNVSNWIVVALMTAMAFHFFFREVPVRNEEIKESMAFIRKNKKEGEKLYVYYSAVPACTFYRQTGFFRFNGPVRYGTKNRDDRSRYIEEITRLEGNCWLLFAHDFNHEEEYILDGLDGSGFRCLDGFKTKGSCVYLYELTGREEKAGNSE